MAEKKAVAPQVDLTEQDKIKTIEVEVREVEIEENGKQKKFLAYKAYQANGKKIDLKFRREANNIPKENCFIKVHVDNMNINRNKKFPELWVIDVIEIITLDERKHNEQDYKEFDDMFKKLPF